MAVRAGVVLSGCGVFDGSEIHEAVSVLVALDQQGAAILCMAPDVPQAATINHLSKSPEPAARNVLQESARIARGNIRSLSSVHAQDLDVLVFPGGFGAAKNLCTFAADGPECRVDPQVERLLLEMHQARKPIGLACIAPVLAARVFGQRGLRPVVSIGTDVGTAQAIGAMKAEHRETAPDGVCVDEVNRLVTTPCYMNNVGPAVVFEGARKMVQEVLRLAASR